jgi:two-component system, cell cycle response regulator
MGDGSAERWRRAARVTGRTAAQDEAPSQAGCVAAEDPTADDTLRLVHSQPKVRRPRSSREHGTLLVVEGVMAGHLHAVASSQPTTLGRGDEADVQVGDDSVSRAHARIQPSRGCYFMQDLDSANGTFVNGQPVRGSQQLEGGDTISLGAATLLRFDLHSLREQQALLELERSAMRDPLTGLLNRRHFQERLAAEVAFASRRGDPLAVLMVDIDHFKRINDQHGHPAGDAVLRVVAQTLRRIVRPEDLAARYGGDELILAARDTDARNGTILAQRIRRIVDEAPFTWEGQRLHLTVSVGVAVLSPQGPETDETLIAAADEALYGAKRAGRNRVSSHT